MSTILNCKKGMFTLTAVFPLTRAKFTCVGPPSKEVVLLATSLFPPSTTSNQPSLVTPTPNTSLSSEDFLVIKNFQIGGDGDLVQGQLWVFQEWRPKGGRWGYEIAPQLSPPEPDWRMFISCLQVPVLVLGLGGKVFFWEPLDQERAGVSRQAQWAETVLSDHL